MMTADDDKTSKININTGKNDDIEEIAVIKREKNQKRQQKIIKEENKNENMEKEKKEKHEPEPNQFIIEEIDEKNVIIEEVEESNYIVNYSYKEENEEKNTGKIPNKQNEAQDEEKMSKNSFLDIYDLDENDLIVEDKVKTNHKNDKNVKIGIKEVKNKEMIKKELEDKMKKNKKTNNAINVKMDKNKNEKIIKKNEIKKHFPIKVEKKEKRNIEEQKDEVNPILELLEGKNYPNENKSELKKKLIKENRVKPNLKNDENEEEKEENDSIKEEIEGNNLQNDGYIKERNIIKKEIFKQNYNNYQNYQNHSIKDEDEDNDSIKEEIEGKEFAKNEKVEKEMKKVEIKDNNNNYYNDYEGEEENDSIKEEIGL